MVGMEGTPFGSALRELRTERRWSLRDLGLRITYHRGYIGKVEQGDKFPERRFAELADTAFRSNVLVPIWEREFAERRTAERLGRLLRASTADSLKLIESSHQTQEFDQVLAAGGQLALTYLHAPAASMLTEAVELRSEILRRIRSHDHRPTELGDLYLTLGRIQGVLAYAALDLGDPEAAMVHARAAGVCADRVGSNELRAWVLGTRSLIARFDQRYADAERFIHDGLRLKVTGTGRIRLLSGLAQCRANLGDAQGAYVALAAAEREREGLTTTDDVEGLFGFSFAKQHYYAGSSLMWLPGQRDLERAARESEFAVSLWQAEGPGKRSLDDETLAHIYAATAHIRLGDLDAAGGAVLPVLHLPADRRISWVRKRLASLAAGIERQFPGSIDASALGDQIERFVQS